MTFYEGTLHIPCIIRPAGGIRECQFSGLTDQLDLTATMLDCTRAKPFAESDGVDFNELGGVVAVLDGRFKMVMDIKTREPPQVFDLENYPKELQNIAKDSSFESTRKELLERMEIHL